MKRPNSSIFGALLLASIAGFGLAGQAAAEDEASRARLAPPGPCAEARDAVGAGDAGSSFSIVGPVAALLNPLSVAAQAPRPAQAPPIASATTRPGSCDEPGAGCRGRRDQVNPPITPGGRPGGLGGGGQSVD